MFFFFFKQKTAYEMRISDWSSDVCSSDLHPRAVERQPCGVDVIGDEGRCEISIQHQPGAHIPAGKILRHASGGEQSHVHGKIAEAVAREVHQIGRASCRKECVSTCRSRWAPYH